jgi:hypothetical protein
VAPLAVQAIKSLSYMGNSLCPSRYFRRRADYKTWVKNGQSQKNRGKSSLHVEVKTVIYPSRVGCTLPTLPYLPLCVDSHSDLCFAGGLPFVKVAFFRSFSRFVNTSSRLNPSETAFFKVSDTLIPCFPEDYTTFLAEYFPFSLLSS